MSRTFPLANSGYIEAMLNERRLEKVTPSLEMTEHLLAQALESLGTAQREAEVAPTSAFKAIEDSVRLSFTAFLQAQGLRPTSESGHHHVVIDAVNKQLVNLGVFKALAAQAQAIRIRRNQLSYPDRINTISEKEVEEGIKTATQLHVGVTNALKAGAIPIF